MPASKISDIIYTISLDEINQLVKNAYDAKYNGTWSQSAHFEFNHGKLQLFAPGYTKYMLYGRGPGKRPPIQGIEDWMSRYNVHGNAFAIATNIGKYGTKNYGKDYSGQNFITQIYPEIENTLCDKLSKKVEEQVTLILNNLSHNR